MDVSVGGWMCHAQEFPFSSDQESMMIYFRMTLHKYVNICYSYTEVSNLHHKIKCSY